MLANHARYGSSVVLQNLAYDIALSVRQAQVYGIAVARLGTGSYTFSAGYGMHFDKGATQYILFGDNITANGIYNSGEAISITNIASGYSVYDLCGTPLTSSTSTCGYSKLDILYLRPEPGAWISLNSTGPDSCLLVHQNCWKNAIIKVQSPLGSQMSVTVWGNGQISVQQNVTSL